MSVFREPKLLQSNREENTNQEDCKKKGRKSGATGTRTPDLRAASATL